MVQASSPWSLPQRLAAVVDTDVILANVGHEVKYGVTPRLVYSAQEGTVRLFASNHVYFEVYEKLPEVAADMGIEAALIRDDFENVHLPLIRFVSVPDEVPSRSRSSKITHATDIPTGYLSELIAPCILFSRDRHLKGPGLAPQDWLSVAKATVDAGERDRRQQAMGVAFMAPGAGAFLFLRWLSRLLRVPGWLVVVGSGVVAANVLWDTNRGERMGTWASELGSAAVAILEEGRQLEEAGLAQLGMAAVSPIEHAPPEQLIARALAWVDEPLLAAEIAEFVEETTGRQDLTIRDIRAVLNSDGAFVRRQHARYQLGRRAGPLR